MANGTSPTPGPDGPPEVPSAAVEVVAIFIVFTPKTPAKNVVIGPFAPPSRLAVTRMAFGRVTVGVNVRAVKSQVPNEMSPGLRARLATSEALLQRLQPWLEP